MSLAEMKDWIESCVTRMGIPIAQSEPYSAIIGEAQIYLGGEHEHTRICYTQSQYWLEGYNPYLDYTYHEIGTGDLAVQIRKCREASFTTDDE